MDPTGRPVGPRQGSLAPRSSWSAPKGMLSLRRRLSSPTTTGRVTRRSSPTLTPPGGPALLKDPFPVRAGPSGDVVVELKFWRPQRLPIEPETGDWYDVGGLGYLAFRGGVLFGP